MGTKNSKEQSKASPVSAGRNQKKAPAGRTSETPKQSSPLKQNDQRHQTSCDPCLFNSKTFLRSSTDPKQKSSGPAISRELDDKWKERIRKEDSKEVKIGYILELKRGILSHIDQKMSNRCTEYSGALIRRVIELTKAEEFTRILNAVTSYYTSNNIATGGPDQEKAAQLDKISTTTFKTMTTEGSLFAELLEVFEAHILFQFSGKLKRLLDLSYDPRKFEISLRKIS